jgi:hypothetical protein
MSIRRMLDGVYFSFSMFIDYFAFLFFLSLSRTLNVCFGFGEEKTSNKHRNKWVKTKQKNIYKGERELTCSITYFIPLGPFTSLSFSVCFKIFSCAAVAMDGKFSVKIWN